jgi:hypothetical protein
MIYYLWDNDRYFVGIKDFTAGIRPAKGTPTKPNDEPNQRWMGNEWQNIPKRQKTLDEYKVIGTAKVTKEYDDLIVSSTKDIAEFERNTWEIQRTEWLRFQDNNLANTPYCDTLCQARGITKELLMEKIGNKVVQIAAIQGQLHQKLDQIKACLSEEEYFTLMGIWYPTLR